MLATLLSNWMTNNRNIVYSVNGVFTVLSLILLVLLWVYYSKLNKSSTLNQYKENDKKYRGILAAYTVIILLSIIIFGATAYVYKLV